LASIEWPGAPTDFWWALWTSAVVGGFIGIYQWPRPEMGSTSAGSNPRAGRGFREIWWERGGRAAFGALGVGCLNILLVTAAVLGVGSAVESEPVTTPAVSSP
jgi:hypothetical protein